ncbi:conserved hypothetical protein [Neospora caninum Liverpool]|uniref:Dense granule protein GRA12 n=1 Tax=Neospora caninum (strain Liverpool) TaxID=572307 RepID=F0V9S2_NEOCL|nr:conserved hypothetical protein [Neospora caninum Liverpool]CBZ50233.1 conserved hypothetical protein [Neospora caninum Liverpool]CEL64834.1 TPA: hypothetical protein BN1204_007080 [Neospora caninum Liverpool]|eukprot:XP_003880268.1 conserved hypothetical protein [Neospora caninum Liverpool]
MDYRRQNRGAVPPLLHLFPMIVAEGVAAGIFLSIIVSAEVGLRYGGMSTEFDVESHGHNWILDSGACFLGLPRNLVVDPILDSEFMKSQKLVTDNTGPRLCRWLEGIYRMHMKQKPAWEASHQKLQGAFPLLRLMGLVKKPIMVFPEFRLRITVKHFSLWEDDRWGQSLPWICATVAYALPDGKGAELFAHIDRVFSIHPERQEATPVHLLLNPSPTFNQYVDFHKISHISAQHGARKICRILFERESNVSISKAAEASEISDYLPRESLTLRFSKNNFWTKDENCYILSKLTITSSINDMSLCKVVAGNGARGLWPSLWRRRIKPIALTVIGVDFFNFRRPTFAAVVKEGIQLKGISDTPVLMELVTDPTLVPAYVAVARQACGSSWGKNVFSPCR